MDSKIVCCFAAILLCGCSQSTEPSKAEKAAWDELNEQVIKAMCAPWGATKEYILSDLVEASQNPVFDPHIDPDEIFFMASDVEQEDCIKAGYSVSGPKPPDMDRERRSCRGGDHSVLDWMTDEVAGRVMKGNQKRRENCKKLGLPYGRVVSD